MAYIIIFSIVSLLFVFLGIAISRYKCYWLIAGYNTASKEEKARIDIENVAKHMSRMCYLIAFILFLGSMTSKYYSISILPFIILMLVVIFGYLFYIQRFDHNKKNKAETIVIIIIAFVAFSITLITFSFGAEPNKIKVTENTIIIDGSFGTSIKKQDIKSIELIESLPEVTLKVNGYSDGGSVKKGDFKLKSGEKVKLYIQSNTGPYIKISTVNNDIYINYKDNKQTLASLKNLK